MTNMKEGQYGWLLTRTATHSGQPEFHVYIDYISNMILGRAGVSSDAVTSFVAVLHSNLTADLYINDFATQIEIMLKRDVKADEGIGLMDIADIRGMKFPDIEIGQTDKVICCFKRGWSFGLFFNLNPMVQQDIAAMELTLGSLYRYLSFKHVYDSLERPAQYESMILEGWFPFIEIIGKEYKELASIYEDRFDYENRINKIIDGFDGDRIDKMIAKWWRKPVFQEKQTILQAGISAFLGDTQDGNINCIKNLLTEVDGILRIQYHLDTGEGRPHGTQPLDHITEKCKTRTGSDDSLFFPELFLSYLKDVVFRNFKLETGQLDLSRHTSSHGVAAAIEYTRAKALQSILVLDQMNYYI
jgi:hypothetical protein